MSRHAPYIVNSTATTNAEAVHEYTPPAPPAQISPSIQRTRNKPEPQPSPDAYHVTKGWIDTANRTRTWLLRDPQGSKVAEICAKRDAQKVADMLNRAENKGRGR